MYKTKRSLKKIQKNFYLNEYSRKIRKFLFVNSVSRQSKLQINFCLHSLKSLSNKYSKVKLKSICILSSRSKSVNKHFNISRIIQREMLSFGIVPGYKKAIW